MMRALAETEKSRSHKPNFKLDSACNWTKSPWKLKTGKGKCEKIVQAKLECISLKKKKQLKEEKR